MRDDKADLNVYQLCQILCNQESVQKWYFMKKVILITFYTIIITLVIGEVLVRRVAPQQTFSQAFLLSDKCYAKSNVTPFTLKKNYTCQLHNRFGDFDIQAKINNDRYRGDELIEISDETKRMLVLGDSFAFGYGVEDDQTIPVKLASMLAEKGEGYDVVNVGFSAGFSPDSYYAYMKDRGLKLSPDVVVLLYFPFNDVTDQQETVWKETDEHGLPLKVSSSDRVVDQGIYRYVNTTVEYKYPILRESHLFHWFVNVTRKRFKLFENQKFPTDGSYKVGCILDPLCIDILLKEEEQQVYQVFKGFEMMAKEEGFEFFVVVIPTDYQLYPDSFGKYKNTRPVDPRRRDFYQKRFGAFMNQLGVKYLDLYPVFDSARDRGNPFFPNDAHFNDLGTSITAESIVNFLEDPEGFVEDLQKDSSTGSGEDLEDSDSPENSEGFGESESTSSSEIAD